MSLTGERVRKGCSHLAPGFAAAGSPQRQPCGAQGQPCLEDRGLVSSQVSSQSQFIAWPHKCECWQKGRIRGGEVARVRELGGAGLDLQQDMIWLNVTMEQDCKLLLWH